MTSDLVGHADKIFDPIHERTTHPIEFSLQDGDGVPIPGSALDSLTFKQYAIGSAEGVFINDRDGTEDLKSHVNEDGLFSLELTPDDTVIVDDTKKKERHILIFRWTYGDFGEKENMVRYEIPVLNHANV